MRSCTDGTALSEVMKNLYGSEINSGMSSFWDAGFMVWIGLEAMDGKLAEEQFYPEDFDKAAQWLHEQALKYFPKSDYAKIYGAANS